MGEVGKEDRKEEGRLEGEARKKGKEREKKGRQADIFILLKQMFCCFKFLLNFCHFAPSCGRRDYDNWVAHVLLLP